MLPKNQVQIILFSETFPDHALNANKIELQRNELSVDSIRQFCRNEEHKYEVLVSLYQLLTIGQSIIFCRVRPPYSMCASSPNTHAHSNAPRPIASRSA